MKAKKLKTLLLKRLVVMAFIFIAVLCASVFYSSASSSNLELCSAKTGCTTSSVQLTYQCGKGSQSVTTSIDFGCDGSSSNGVTDLLFAIIRFLSAGVGLVIIASLIVGGIQYIVSRGDPNATGAAVKRLTSSVVALVVFLFGYAILNFVIPGGFFK